MLRHLQNSKICVICGAPCSCGDVCDDCLEEFDTIEISSYAVNKLKSETRKHRHKEEKLDDNIYQE